MRMPPRYASRWLSCKSGGLRSTEVPAAVKTKSFHKRARNLFSQLKEDCLEIKSRTVRLTPLFSCCLLPSCCSFIFHPSSSIFRPCFITSCLFCNFALFYAEITPAGSLNPVTSLIPHYRPDWLHLSGLFTLSESENEGSERKTFGTGTGREGVNR